MPMKNSEYSILLPYAKFPAHWHMEMLNKCWVRICMPINDLGQSGSLIFTYRHHISMVPTEKLMGTITRGLSKKVKKSMDLLCTGSRGIRDCSRFLVALLLSKMKWKQWKWQYFDKFKLSNLWHCYKMTRHREIFQIYHTFGWSSTW